MAENYSYTKSVQKGAITSAQTFVITGGVVYFIFSELLHKNITMEQSVEIALIIGAISGGLKYILNNWKHNDNNIFKLFYRRFFHVK